MRKQVDPTNRIEYGDGLWAFTGLRLHEDSGALSHTANKLTKVSFNDTASYSLDIRKSKDYHITFTAGMATKTLTFSAMTQSPMSSSVLEGTKLTLVFKNGSAGVVNLSYAFPTLGLAMPTTVAAGAYVSTVLEYHADGWVRLS